MNLMMLLEMAANGFGERVAFGSRDSGLTYQQVFDRAGALAAELDESGVDHVGMLDVASEAMPIAMFAGAWANKPFVPLNFRLKPDEITGLAERVSPIGVVVNADTAQIAAAAEGATPIERGDLLSRLADADGPGRDNDWPMDPEDIAVLLFTSGTTGAPKTAVLRHKHITSYILGSVEFMGAGEDEAALMSVPPYHIAGIAGICSAVFAGRRVVQLPQFDADAWIDTVRAESITHAMVVPTMLARIVDRLVERDDGPIESLRHLPYGGGKMPLPVITKALELFPNTNFVNAYGLTETSSTIAVLGPDDHRTSAASEDPEVARRLGSVGRPLPTLEVSIRDDEGNEVAQGESGEIWVRGEQVSGEYVGRDSRVTAEGWLPTNDGGSIDAEGYLFVEGRLDDVIVRGGENISPGEIEDVLLDHEAIRDAAVIGKPDEQWGEDIAAFIVVADGLAVEAETVRTFVRDRLRSSRTPADVIFVDELPYNETGKLLRRSLREQL